MNLQNLEETDSIIDEVVVAVSEIKKSSNATISTTSTLTPTTNASVKLKVLLENLKHII